MLSSATRGPSQNEQISASSSSKAPHFEHICITGPFCAAEVPVRNGGYGSTIAFAPTIAVASPRKCRVSGNPHPEPYFSPCAPRQGYFAQILTSGATGATRYRPDCDRSGRVLGSILFLRALILRRCRARQSQKPFGVSFHPSR